MTEITASVFAWSIGNEVDYPNDPYSHPILDGDGGFTQAMYGGYKKDAPDAMRLGDIAKRLVKVVKQYDISRPVTAGLAGVAMSNETEYPGALDIAGYNYTESRYDSDHLKYPGRVIYGSENQGTIWKHGERLGIKNTYWGNFCGLVSTIWGNPADGLRVDSIRGFWILVERSNRAVIFVRHFGRQNRWLILELIPLRE